MKNARPSARTSSKAKTTSIPRKKSTAISDTKFTFLKKDYEGATVYIGNLDYKKDEIAVRNLFRKYGRVIRVKLVTDPKTKLKKGYGFAQMPNIEDAKSAVKELNGRQLDGRTLKVSLANDRRHQ